MNLLKYYCYDCKNYFHINGEDRIGSHPCDHCGSYNVDHCRDKPINGTSSAEVLKIDAPIIERKFIVKVYQVIKNFHPLYFIGPADKSEIKPVGTITTDGLVQMKNNELLKEISAQQIKAIYKQHKWFLTDIATSKFYEVKTNI